MNPSFCTRIKNSKEMGGSSKREGGVNDGQPDEMESNMRFNGNER